MPSPMNRMTCLRAGVRRPQPGTKRRAADRKRTEAAAQAAQQAANEKLRAQRAALQPAPVDSALYAAAALRNFPALKGRPGGGGGGVQPAFVPQEQLAVGADVQQ